MIQGGVAKEEGGGRLALAKVEVEVPALVLARYPKLHAKRQP